MKTPLTVTSARTAEPRETRYSLTSERVPGLALHVYPSGRKTFAWTGRVAGSRTVVSVTIGTFGVVTTHQAETRALEIAALARSGVDPRAERTRQRAVQAAADTGYTTTFADTAAAYLLRFEAGEAATSKRNVPRPASVRREVISVKRAVDILGTEPIATVGRREALRLRDAHADLSDSSRRHAWSAASRVVAHALEEGLVETNIFRSLKGPRATTARERYLSPAELAAVWHAADEFDAPWRQLVHLMILVPVRLSNATGARWEDLRGDVLHLPTTKNRTPWPVPVSPAALAVLRTLLRGDGLIFPSAGDSRGRGVGGPLKGVGQMKARLDKASGVERWRLHDLRRTFASLLSDRRDDVDPLAIDLALQHRPPGVRGVYNASRSVPAVRRVLALWADEVAAILAEHGREKETSTVVWMR
jgi:integrase